MKIHSVAFEITHQDLAYVVFAKQQLVFWEVHSLSNNLADALGTAAAQVSRALGKFHITSAVIEQQTRHPEKIDELLETVRQNLRRTGVPIFETSEKELLDSFGSPP